MATAIAQPVVFRQRLRAFFQDLCADAPPAGAAHLDRDWTRAVVLTRRAARGIRSSCRHYDDADDVDSRTWNVYIPSPYLSNDARLREYVATLEAPDWFAEEAGHCVAPGNARKTRHKLALIQLWPVYRAGAAGNRVRVTPLGEAARDMHWRANDPNNHSALLLLNFEKRTQEFFDPSGDSATPCYARAFAARGAFLPDICPTVRPARLFDPNQTLQHALQTASGLQDLCSAACAMTALTALRFGVLDLRACGGHLRAAVLAVTPSPQRKRFVRRFLWWLNTKLQDDVTFEFEVPLVAEPQGMCALVSKSSGRMCTRRRCAGSEYCWQHRHLWKNPFAVPPRRMACAKNLANQPRPPGTNGLLD